MKNFGGGPGGRGFRDCEPIPRHSSNARSAAANDVPKVSSNAIGDLLSTAIVTGMSGPCLFASAENGLDEGGECCTKRHEAPAFRYGGRNAVVARASELNHQESPAKPSPVGSKD